LSLEVSEPAAASPGLLSYLLWIPCTYLFAKKPIINKSSPNYTVLKMPSVSCGDHDEISDTDIILKTYALLETRREESNGKNDFLLLA
jgi:hypothetical protein